MVGRDCRIIVSKIVPKNAKNFDKRTSRSKNGKIIRHQASGEKVKAFLKKSLR